MSLLTKTSLVRVLAYIEKYFSLVIVLILFKSSKESKKIVGIDILPVLYSTVPILLLTTVFIPFTYLYIANVPLLSSIKHPFLPEYENKVDNIVPCFIGLLNVVSINVKILIAGVNFFF